MATGIVPVSTRVGEVPNVIRHGHDGWLYETADEAVASLSQPTDEMATNAQQTASTRFGQAQAVARYLRVYNAE
jgi:glycosyltransferase involved in cell wall biosynthesis